MKDSGTEKKWKLPSLNNPFKKNEIPADILPNEPDNRTIWQKIWAWFYKIFSSISGLFGKMGG